MKDTTELRGLGDLKTATTTHLRAKPAREGTEYLDLYLASAEKKRLARLMQTWEKQKRRAEGRHAAVDGSMARLEEKMGLERSAGADPHIGPDAGDEEAPAPDYARRQWNMMPVEY